MSGLLCIIRRTDGTFFSVNGFTEGIAKIKNEVLQGSFIGPYLFLKYINDLSFFLGHIISTYGDDSSILYSVESMYAAT